MADQTFKVDLTKPLVFQVGHLRASYDEWVHKPIIGKDTPRFFENDFMELMTRTVWWVIPLVWLPVASFFASSSARAGIPPCHVAAAVVGGVFMWTLMEYCLHRFLFHMKTTTYWGNTLHYLLHGCHHKHPMDALRLVFPPAAAAILAVPLWSAFKLLTPAPYSPALFGGALLGYVVYDCTHYYLHHGKPFKGIAHELKRNHMDHHFRIQHKGFGITSTLWDRVFGTLAPRIAKKIS
ncbi:dihydroceramide fatty acyl 2-hydroxylase FAH1-like isoform X2 [Salvia miltiorrhiza]|uniref:dihydroceramide fatty acyl 2-hydroxylase FAH1-like isoform X2 n=1 Tax=Salvia miltiorrhiza TaxID=226208 RepID=UPI0025AC3EA4|nr:dihydroceramide fatty acyl 2-hydroxylase FAH1-like isoform X2 [Salvia miltiorrhiza]